MRTFDTLRACLLIVAGCLTLATAAPASAANLIVRGSATGSCEAGDARDYDSADSGAVCLPPNAIFELKATADEVGCDERPAACNTPCVNMQTEVRGIGSGGVKITERYLKSSASATADGSIEGCCAPVICPFTVPPVCSPQFVPAGIGTSLASLEGRLIDLAGVPGSHEIDIYIDGRATVRGSGSATSGLSGYVGNIQIVAANVTHTAGGATMHVHWTVDGHDHVYDGRPMRVHIEGRIEVGTQEEVRFDYTASASAQASSNDSACSDASASTWIDLQANYGGLRVSNDCP